MNDFEDVDKEDLAIAFGAKAAKAAPKPVKFPGFMTATFYFIDDDDTIAMANYQFPPTEVPTEEELKAALAEVIDKVPPGFSLMTHDEALNTFLREERKTPIHMDMKHPLPKGDWIGS